MEKLQYKTRKHHTLVSQEANPFEAGDDKAATNRRESMTDKKDKQQKDPEKKHRL